MAMASMEEKHFRVCRVKKKKKVRQIGALTAWFLLRV